MIVIVAIAYAQDASFHLAQARQFVKNRWYDDAAREIEQALAKGGGADFEVNWLGAQVYQELVQMRRATELARRAVDLAPNEDARARCQAVVEYLANGWGELRITAPYDAMSSRLQVEAQANIPDPEERRLFNKVALQLKEKTTLPVEVSLPIGAYLVNGVPITVVAGGEKEVALQLDQLGAKGLAALQVARLEISAGTLARFGDAAAGMSLAPSVEVGFTQPIGALLLGVVADWEPRAYATVADDTTFDPRAWAAGVRVGRELSVGGPLAVRPSVGARYVSWPGVEVGCAWADAERTGLTCGRGEGTSGVRAGDVLAAYVDGWGVAPFADLALEYREGGRTTALGVGVKVAVEDLLLFTPKEGDVAPVDDPAALVHYQAQLPPLNVPGVRLYATVDLAF